MKINEAHFEKWLVELRSTTMPQIAHNLIAYDHQTGEVGMCCLGVGSVVAGLEVTRQPDWDIDTGHIEGCTSLAPRDFIEWLGIEPPLGLLRVRPVHRLAGAPHHPGGRAVHQRPEPHPLGVLPQ